MNVIAFARNHHSYAIVCVFVIQSVIAGFADYGWEDTPPDVINVLAGDNLTLTYSYRAPQSHNGPVKVELSQHLPDNNYENVLCEASIDTHKNSVQIHSELHPGRVQIIPRDGGLSFCVQDIKLGERGRYWADVGFSSGTELHESTQVETFARPSFIHTPLPRQIVHQINETASLEWSLVKDASLPNIESIQIVHTVDGASFTVVDQRKPPNLDHWNITYPNEQQKFEGRICYVPGPKLEHIRFSVWNLKVGDSGYYKIQIVYRNHIAKLEHVSKLVVTTGYRWRVRPNATTFLVTNQNNRMEFQVETENKNTPVTYELDRIEDQHNEILLGYVKVNPGVSELKTDNCRDNWSMTFDKVSQTVVVVISNAASEDGGHYIMKVVDEAQSVILEQDFFLSVLNDSDLSPIITTTPLPAVDDTTTCVSVSVRNHALEPDIIIHRGTRVIDGAPVSHEVSYTGEAPDVYARTNNTSGLDMCVSRSIDEDMTYTVVVIYDSTAASTYMITRQFDVPRLRQTSVDAITVNTLSPDDTDSRNQRDMCVPLRLSIAMWCTLASAGAVSILVAALIVRRISASTKNYTASTKQPEVETVEIPLLSECAVNTDTLSCVWTNDNNTTESQPQTFHPLAAVERSINTAVCINEHSNTCTADSGFSSSLPSCRSYT